MSNRTPQTMIVRVERGEPWTDSQVIAEEFGRAHKSVLRSIDRLIKDGTIDGHDFVPVEYLDAKGESRRAYKLNERAALTAMPFIGGNKSRAGQKRLVDAFLAMRKELTRQSARRQGVEWQEERAKLTATRHGLTDVIKEFVTYATAQGSKGANWTYSNITKMENKTLFMVDTALGSNLRDRLTATQLGTLATAENIARRALAEGMAKGMRYKVIYAMVRDRVEQFSGLIGRTLPGDDRPMLLGE